MWGTAPNSNAGRAAAVLLLAAAAGALAQSRAVAIQDATVLTGTGRVLPQATVLFSEGQITAVGPQVSAGLFARKIRATGKYVTPGLIDVYTTLGLRLLAGPGSPTARAADGFDRYAQDELRNAWRDGVTLVYLPVRAGAGIGGYGSVIRLGAEQPVVTEKAALCATLAAAGPQGPVARLKTLEELRRRFQAARDYRTAWEDYEEAVKEYEQKLAERNRKSSGAADRKEAAPDRPATQAGPARAEKPQPAPPATDKPEAKPASEPAAARPEPKKEEELKKPVEPNKDRGLETLLRVLDGEVRLRVEAHAPADILNVLALAQETRAALVLEGATGAHLVARELAAAHVPVIVTADPAPVAFVAAERHAALDGAARLEAAGVEVFIGSGVLETVSAAPHLTARVARALGGGLKAANDPLALVTSRAARLLGLEKEFGELAEGRAADLVVWSDDPFAPDARVERVFVAGIEVYRAEDTEAAGE